MVTNVHADINDGLVAHLSFENGFTDDSRNGAVIFGSFNDYFTLTAGPVGNAAKAVSNSGQHISLYNQNGYYVDEKFEDVQHSISIWVKIPDVNVGVSCFSSSHSGSFNWGSLSIISYDPGPGPENYNPNYQVSWNSPNGQQENIVYDFDSLYVKTKWNHYAYTVTLSGNGSYELISYFNGKIGSFRKLCG